MDDPFFSVLSREKNLKQNWSWIDIADDPNNLPNSNESDTNSTNATNQTQGIKGYQLIL